MAIVKEEMNMEGGVNINPEDYKCAICQDTLVTLEPIRMCTRGHNFHQQCLYHCLTNGYRHNGKLSEIFDTRNIKCPMCKIECLASRNLMLEQIFTLFPIKCRNIGCEFITKCGESKNMKHHEKICHQRNYISSCSDKQFKWTERLKFLVNEINEFNMKNYNSIPPISQEMQPASDNTIDFIIMGNFEEKFNSDNNYSIELNNDTPNIIIFDLHIYIALHASIWKEELLTQRLHIFNPLELKFNLKYEAVYTQKELDGHGEPIIVSSNNMKLFDISIDGSRYTVNGTKKDIPSFYIEDSSVKYIVSLTFPEPIDTKKYNSMLECELSDISIHTTLYSFSDNSSYTNLDDFLFEIGFKNRTESMTRKTSKMSKTRKTSKMSKTKNENENENERIQRILEEHNRKIMEGSSDSDSDSNSDSD